MNSKILISPLLIGSIALGNLLVLAAVSGASIAPTALQSANNMIQRICIDKNGNEYPCP